MDPSHFMKGFGSRREEFIESWVSEYHRNDRSAVDSPGKSGNRGRPAYGGGTIQHYFATARAEPLGFTRLMKQVD